jgi:U4/U6.U5 tri-snRNP-associated protein 1
MADALSIEQNNKIRVALGLKPLPVPGAASNGPAFKESSNGDDGSQSSEDNDPGSTLESRSAQAGDNWRKLQEEEQNKKQRQAKRDAIKKAREVAQRMAKLEGKSLGEADTGEAMDTKSWLMQHKKLQKKIEKDRAKKLAAELAEREQMAAAEYTAKDLAGVRVAHEMRDFDDIEGEQILTLKDTTIDEDEDGGAELENVALRDMEKTKERLESKKKRTGYDPLDTEANTSILAQYDEEIEGKKRKHFTLDAQQMPAEAREAKRQIVSSKLKSQEVSLDDIALPEAAPSDYLDPSEIKMKKPKKKKAKTTRRKIADDDDIFPTVETTETPKGAAESNGNGMEIDAPDGGRAPVKRRVHDDDSFFDDDDLQASLAAQRRAALKKRKKMTAEDLARQLREESEQAANGMDVDQGDGDEEGPGLIIDETSEFVANLQRPTVPEPRKRSISRVTKSPSAEPGEGADVDMDRSYNDIEDEEELKERLRREVSTPTAPGITATGLEEEATLDKGLGATLAMLKQRGLVKETNSGDLNALHRERQRFLLQKQHREAEAERKARLQRERDRASGKLDRMSARDREEYARWENKQRDQQESRQMADIFNREYKPDVQIKYVDEFGRTMNQKEAFKHLSHQFHGKGSGKMKTEKHLKKIEEEKKREAMSTLDSSQHTNMNNAMGATAKRNRQAGVRLA